MHDTCRLEDAQVHVPRELSVLRFIVLIDADDARVLRGRKALVIILSDAGIQRTIEAPWTSRVVRDNSTKRIVPGW